jgi:hypothetical protein
MNLSYLKTDNLSHCMGYPFGTSLRLLFMGVIAVCCSLSAAQIELEQDTDVEIVIDLPGVSDEEPSLTDPVELTEEEKAAARARSIEISRQLSLRTEAIENLQSDRGIYSPELQEAYSDLAGFYLELEDHESAIKLYNDALQVARINTGLHSEEQLPIIQALELSQSKINAWDEVDRLHQLEYFVASRTFEIDDPSYRQAVEDYGRWKLRVVKENILDQSSRELLNAATDLSNFYGLALNKLESQSNAQPEELLNIISGKSETDLALARSVASTPSSAFAGTVSQYVTESRCQNRQNAQGQLVRQCVNVQVENPRYRQSQRDAKNIALRRYTRQIEISVERLQYIRDTSSSLTEADKLNLDSQIATLETEAIQLERSERRLFGF